MSSLITLQNHNDFSDIPSQQDFDKWVSAVFFKKGIEGEITIRLVDQSEMADLNKSFRDKEGPTNVLAFAYDATLDDDEKDFLGDIAICVPVALQEAKDQHKSQDAHFAHLTIHAVLHLLGYDHEQEEDTVTMQNLEIDLLASLGFADPYTEELISNHD